MFTIVAITLNKSTNFLAHGRFQSIILQLWCFGSFVLATLYVGKYVSVLLVQRQESTVDSLDDFLHNSKYKLYIEKETVYYNRVKHSPLDMFKDVFEQVQRGRGGVVTKLEAFSKVENDPYSVFFTGFTSLDAHYRNICKIQQGGYIGKSTYFPAFLAFPIRKGFKDKTIISGYIDKIVSAGIPDETMSKYRNEKCPMRRRKTGLLLGHFYDSFMLIFCGICLSSLALLREVIRVHTNYYRNCI